MTIPLPIIIAGGAAALLISGKNKKRRSNTSKETDISAAEPQVIHDIIDESMLDKYSEPTGEEAGDFDTKEDDVSLDDEDDASSDSSETPEEQPVEPYDPGDICEEFLNAVYVAQPGEGELPINKIAVEQTVIPAMKDSMLDLYKNLGGPLDADSIAPIMIVSALNQMIPVCEWSYDEENYEFTYASGERIESDVGKDIVYGLFKISGMLIDDFNEGLENG